jgi:hypothetical protein
VFNSPLNKLIEADIFGRSSFNGTSVKLRVDAGIEFAEEVADRIDAVFCEDIEERSQGLCALGLERGNVGGVEVRAAVQTEKFAAQHVGIGVISDNRAIVVDAQDIHGFTHFLISIPFSVISESN